MEKDKMHRVVKIGTGKVTYVSGALAKDPDLLLDYGFILQELPEEKIEDIVKENTLMGEDGNKTNITIDMTKISEEVEKLVEEKPKRAYNKQTK